MMPTSGLEKRTKSWMSIGMKQNLQITATIDQPDFLETMIEKLAFRRNDRGYRKQTMPDSRELLETSSTETFISGSMEIDSSDEHVYMPFITSFLFTCVKLNGGAYKLEWSSSLS